MKSLLIIDDDDMYRRALSRVLSRTVCVTSSPSVEDALGLIATDHVYDVVLCDMAFAGGLSGRDFYERTLALAPAQADRVLILSGSYPAVGDPLAHRFVRKAAPIDELHQRIVRLTTSRGRVESRARARGWEGSCSPSN